jgi:hypothetical protein
VDGLRFHPIIGFGAGSVRIHVAHFGRRRVRIFKSALHRRGRSRRIGLRDVVRIGRHAKSHDLPEDFRAALLRCVQCLDGEHRGAFAETHAVTICGEWPAGGR